MIKIGLISDTHDQHNKLELPYVDILIHCGDITSTGHDFQVESFLCWFSKQNAKHKIFIAGNHDFYFDCNFKARTEKGERRWRNKTFPSALQINALLKQYPEVTYLDEQSITVEGINIYGSAITPWFHDWAFNRRRGEEIQQCWKSIPTNTDILITHGPPYNIGDLCNHGGRVGCEDLANELKRVQPRIHAFGHIHESYGMYSGNEIDLMSTTFINCSVLDEEYLCVNEPVIINYEEFL